MPYRPVLDRSCGALACDRPLRSRRFAFTLASPQGDQVPGGRGRQAEPCHAVLPGRTGNVGGDYIRGVPVQAAAGPVVPDGGARVSVGCGLLDVAQRHPGVQRRGDKCVPKRVRPHVLADPGPSGDPADDPPGAVPVQPPPVRGQEDRAMVARAVDGLVGVIGHLRARLRPGRLGQLRVPAIERIPNVSFSSRSLHVTNRRNLEPGQPQEKCSRPPTLRDRQMRHCCGGRKQITWFCASWHA